MKRSRREICWILGLWRPCRWFLVLIVAVTLVSTVARISLPLVLKSAFDGLEKNLTHATLLSVVSLYFALGTIDWLLATGLVFLRGSMNLRFEAAARRQAYARLVLQSPAFLQRFRTGDLVTRLTDDVSEKLCWFICSGIFRALAAVAVVVFAVVMMVRLDPVLTLLTVGPLPLLILLFIRTGTVLDRRFDLVQQRISELNGALEACFSGIRVVKAYGRELAEERSFARFARECRGAEIEAAKSQTLIDSLFGHVWQLGVVVVLLAGGIGVMNGRLTLGTFVAFDAYVLMLIFPMFDIGTFFVRGRQSAVSIARLLEVEEPVPEIVERPDPIAPAAPITGHLRFELVSYTYARDGSRLETAGGTPSTGARFKSSKDGWTTSAVAPARDVVIHEPLPDASPHELDRLAILSADGYRSSGRESISQGDEVLRADGTDVEGSRPSGPIAEESRSSAERPEESPSSGTGAEGFRSPAQAPVQHNLHATEAGADPDGCRSAAEATSTEGSPRALSDISFEVCSGEIVAVVGAVGSGKSTLLRLVSRITDPSSGRILLDGNDLRDLPLGVLRSVVGYVPQEALLFSGTIRDNIRFGREEISETDVQAACEIARLGKDLAVLSAGLDTRVGVRGVSLSGGQKQRVALGRALAGRPRILVLDDVTAALDAETEASLWEELHRVLPDLATLVVTHRTSTLERADRILVLDRGRLVEQGTHARLSEEGAVYRSIYRRHVLEERVTVESDEGASREVGGEAQAQVG